MKRSNRLLSLLLAAAMLLSMVYTGPAVDIQAASASSYISTSYPASLSVRTNKTAGLVEVPDASTAAKYTLPADTMLSVKKLHRNTSGKYWYEVLYYDMTLYIDATATTMVDHLTGDVDVADMLTPAALGTGQGFPLGGTITSSLNKLGKVSVTVHRSSNINEAPVISSSDTIDGYSYTMDSSTLDTNMIYSDLSAGSYTHLLTVEAISYYIDEDGALSTSTVEVVLDNKPLIVTTASVSNTIVAKGIDVSVHQGTINWASVAPQIDFAILRIGWEYTLDTQFANNAAGCNANGVPFGVYIYSYAESEAEAVAEAEFVISALKNYDVDLPIFFDIEDEVHKALSASTIQNIVKAFCDTIRDAGYEPGLYTFLSWFNSYFGGSYYNSLPKWVAQVGTSSCSYAKGLTMWQYSWTGSFSGISGDVDCNYYYGEFPGINSDSSYLGKCDYYPSDLIVDITSAVNMRQYPSTDYSVIEELAAGTQIHVTGIYKNSYGNYWYQVEKDGVTGYISSDYAAVAEYLYDDISVVGPTMEDLALNSGYYLKGRLGSKYNSLNKVYAKVYSGEDTLATPVLSSSATPNAKEYVLNYSDVCDNMIFSDLETGYYTYEISADVQNYYVSSGTLYSQTENVVVWTAPFTVGGAAIEPPATVTCDHSIVTDSGYEATCTENGLTDGTHCSKCGITLTEQTVIEAKGHSYTSKVIAATCQDYGKLEYTCGNCQDTYTIYAHEQEAWSESKPEGVDDSQLETKTQYRYSDYGSVTSEAASMEGFTQTGKTWEKSGTGSVHYVSSWPSGFDTTHSLYTQYNKSKVSATETDTTKVVIDSDAVIGNIFYHWCRGTYTEGPINRSTSATKDDTHTTFHAFVANISTIDPSTLTEASDGSVTYANAGCCTDSHWYYYFQVYAQAYTTYKAIYTYEGWGEWSQWSDTAVTATDTRKVETRTVYRVAAALGDHTYVDGVCSLCGAEDPDAGCKHPSHDESGVCASCGETVAHDYVDAVCSICGKAEPVPTIQPSYFSVSFEGEVLINIYFKVSGMEGVSPEDMGMLTWTTAQSDATYETAQTVIPGAATDGTLYMAQTEGIAAKKLGDLVYFKIYARMPDGTYVYSKMYSSSPKSYAYGRIRGTGVEDDLKALCVAMLNYGAEAQTAFSYKPYDLMNSSLTDEEKALIASYDPSMVETLPTVDTTKTAKLKGNGGFSKFYPSISFDEAFSINFYMAPSYEPDSTLKLYYWDPETYASVTELTLSNATSVIEMTPVGETGQHWGALSGIAAKEIDRPGFFAGVYSSDGLTYTTGVICYSLGRYCQTTAANETHETRALAAETAVYGYYAKIYFANHSA